jgi:hypothetical protein
MRTQGSTRRQPIGNNAPEREGHHRPKARRTTEAPLEVFGNETLTPGTR